MIVYFGWDFFSKTIDYESYLYSAIWFLIILFLILVSAEINVKHMKLNSSEMDKKITKAILYTMFFLGLTFMFAHKQVKSVKDKKSTFGTILQLENNVVLISDSTNYFIGKTQNYLFYYHESTKQTDVIPVSKLIQLTIGNKLKK